MLVADNWQDYELLDSGDGERLERWGKFRLRRPDPQVIWPPTHPNLWRKVDGHYHRSGGGGSWEFFNSLPERWAIRYRGLSFHVRPMGFKHLGLFPEQAVNWDWLTRLIQSASRPVRVLNLFAYTGGASVAAAAAGAEVCHVDAAKGMVTWAKENLQLSGLGDRPVRFLVDDVLKFVQREERRGRQYEGIIMDPPSFGRGPNGEVWKIEDELFGLVRSCMAILSPAPLFFLINSYTTGLAPGVLRNILALNIQQRFGGESMADEVGLPLSQAKLILPCGASGRWEAAP